MANAVESRVPKTVTLQSANENLVPYYQDLGFKRA
jgi:hypothetical protein